MRKLQTGVVWSVFTIISASSIGCDSMEEELGEEFVDEGLLEEEVTEEDAGTMERATCYGNGCNGLDPQATPCASDAITAQTKPIYATLGGGPTYVGYVELRWSNSCKTNWARVTRTDGAYAEGMIATITRSDGLSYPEYHEGYTRIWSPMVYAPSPYCARANGLIDLSFVSGSATTSCL